jgi:4-amino-4-deoxychorismate lyase
MIEYSFKSENRQQLDAVFEKRNGCDDIIIIKNRFVTDSRAANILFFDGSDWVTPDTPLLEGVQREYLLSQKLIKMKRIKEGDIKSFQKIKLINAMIDFDRANEISVSTGIIS